jgi:glutamine synthetase
MREHLVAFLYCDLSAIVRGRWVPESSVESRLDAGVGWVPANQSLTPFGTIAVPNPFGALGDLVLRPDPATRVHVDDRAEVDTLEFMLCDAVTPEGDAWACCPRAFLRHALDDLENELNARVFASFEHEFQVLSDESPSPPFSLAAQRRREPFGSMVMAALARAGVEPEYFLPEYGPHQFEIPCAPAYGMAAADRSIILKEVVREIAARLDLRATFSPLVASDAVGNGAHIHFSLVDAGGVPLLHDERRPGRLSALGGSFAAGILRHARALTAFVAPSPLSAIRLAPHRWSAGAAALGQGNREALLRIPGLAVAGRGDVARRYNLEYRAADATANPYLALGGIIRAGLEGVRDELPAPPILDRDLDTLDEAHAADFGVDALPKSLPESLDALERDRVARAWLPPELLEAYAGVKRAEIAAVDGADIDDICRRYAAIY